MKNIIDRINEYLGNGGFFNPELMNHDEVRNLLMDCRNIIKIQQSQIESFNEELKDMAKDMRQMKYKHDDWMDHDNND